MQYDHHAFFINKMGKLLTALQAEKDKRRRQKILTDYYKHVQSNPTLSYKYLKALRLPNDKSSEIMEQWKKEFPSGRKKSNHAALSEQILQSINPENNAIEYLPPCSLVLTIKFKLIKPYMSRDDRDFYIIDNPIKTDKVTGRPYVNSPTWKGCFRAAMTRTVEKATIDRLFGHESTPKGEEKAGRLAFFPSFFKQEELAIEVINPHKRETKVGKDPVTIESVKAGARATFTMLYIPFDLSGRCLEKRDEIIDDIGCFPAAVQNMFADQGFGAKTSAGFGHAHILDGTICFRTPVVGGLFVSDFNGFDQPDPQKPGLAQAIQALVDKIRTFQPGKPAND